jgi:hypothetical protein
MTIGPCNKMRTHSFVLSTTLLTYPRERELRVGGCCRQTGKLARVGRRRYKIARAVLKSAERCGRSNTVREMPPTRFIE